ncbi:CoaE-domain-containing protein [Schizophyllum commune H4-8]|uniref:Dephospho-CoA kinase n=1 Tax=Schizophyllum commune (strain H4-8 / FGSC 9210) TaxID=578458 RepID=D8PUI2_SCHCM|nr:CoaE-domain-containing protein [Schizophyllum commune H4-8]KAI5900666.1 CoaE-domain-containing protein [Schizophyllum commune H4-8]
MLVVGLTGGIATGKSTVSKLLRDADIPIVDADVLARQVVEPGTPALKRIVKAFGPQILLEDGSLNRKALGEIIFNDAEKRKVLNGIVHPAVRWAMVRAIARAWLTGKRVCVTDVPLLIESGIWRFVGQTVVVSCPFDVQLERLMLRDQSTEEAARARINAQMSMAEKVAYADVVLDNSTTPEALRAQVEELLQQWRKQTRYTWLLEWLVPPVGLLVAAVTLAYRNWRYAARRRSISKDA